MHRLLATNMGHRENVKAILGRWYREGTHVHTHRGRNATSFLFYLFVTHKPLIF